MNKAALDSGSATLKRRILVADDDPILSELIQAKLGGPDAVVLCAENGTIARDMLLADRFDLAIIDLRFGEVRVVAERGREVGSDPVANVGTEIRVETGVIRPVPVPRDKVWRDLQAKSLPHPLETGKVAGFGSHGGTNLRLR